MTRCLAILLLMLSPVVRAGEATGVLLNIRSSDLDPAWFKDLTADNRELILKEGKTELPELVARLGTPGELEVVRLRPVAGRAVPAACGIVVQVTPTLGKDDITLVGQVTLLRSGNRTDIGPPPGFVREKTFFKCSLRPGGTKKLLVAHKGRKKEHLEIQVELVDDEGEAVE